MDSVVYMDVSDLVADLKEISELSAEDITENIFRDYGPKIEATAKEYAPVDSGRLKDSIHVDVHGATMTIAADAPYAKFLEFGTASRGEFPGAPYKIRPRNASVLRFEVNGKVVFAKEVTHPGIAPQPYLRPAVLDEVGGLFGALADRGQAYIIKGPRSAL